MNENLEKSLETFSFYQAQVRYEKDYYKEVYRLLPPQWTGILDIGCASGDFLYYLYKKHGNKRVYIGIDCVKSSIDRAQIDMKEECFNWICGDFLDDYEIEVDVATLFGVLYIFKDFEEVFTKVFKYVKCGGRLVVFGSFNRYGLRVEHRYRYDSGKEGIIIDHSMEEISNWLNHKKMNYQWIPFHISTRIEKSNDPIRAWTVDLADGSLGLLNGMNIWRDQFFLVIQC